MSGTAIMLREARAIIGHAWAGVRVHLATLAMFELVITMVTATVLAPALTWVSQSLVRASGRPAVSNFDLLAFGFSPQGLALIVILALAYAGMRSVHESLVVVTIIGRARGWRDATAFIGRRVTRLLAAVAMILGVIVLACLPLIGLCLAAAATLLGEHDINYYLAERPPAFQRLLVLVGATVLVGIALIWTLSVLLSFTTSLVVLEGEHPWRAMRRSVRAAWHARGRTITAHLTLTIIVACATSVTSLIMWAVQEAALALAGGSLAGVLVAVALLLTLQVIVTIGISFATFAMRSAVIACLYQRLFGADVKPAGVEAGRLSRRWVIAGAMAIVMVGTVTTSWLIVRDLRLDDTTSIIAHRGASTVAPENTLRAIEAAIAAGADVVEIDVQETRDGEVIVLHDKDLMRIAGDPRRVWEMTAAEIRAVDIGSWFDPAFADQRVPTLREVIGVVRGRARLLIELKYNGHDVALARRVVDIVREEGIQDSCMLMSLDMRGVEAARRLAPQIPVGAIVATSVGDPARLEVDFLAMASKQVDGARVARNHAAGRGTLAWTVNDASDMNRFYDLGIDGIITDDVELAVSLRDRRADMTLAERILLWFRNRMG